VNHLFANLNSHLPLRLPSVPRNFHTIWPHRFLPLQSPRHYNAATLFFRARPHHPRHNGLFVQLPQIPIPATTSYSFRARSTAQYNGPLLRSPEAPASGNTCHLVAIISNENHFKRETSHAVASA
jgi:hypothetical protein